MLWFDFILGSNLIFLSFKLIIIPYPDTKENKLLTKDKTESQHVHIVPWVHIIVCKYSNIKTSKQ